MTSSASPARPNLTSVKTPGKEAPAAARTAQRGSSTWIPRLLFALGDIVGLLSVLATIYLIAGWVSPTHAPGVFEYALPIVLPVMLIAYAITGLYGNPVTHPALEMERISAVSGVMGVTVGGTVAVVGAGLVPGSALLPGLFIIAGGLIGAVVMPVCRCMIRVLCGPLDWWGLPAVIVSDGQIGHRIVDTLERWPEIGLRPVAVVEAGGAASMSEDETQGLPADLSVSLDPNGALHLARTVDVPYVILALSGMKHVDRSKLLAHYSKFFDHVLVVGDAEGAPIFWTTGRSGRGLSGYGIRNFALQPMARVVKRTVDLLLGTIGMILVAPVFLTIVLLIRADSPGPVFFRQERMGREGRVFTVLKFRTMHLNAQAMLQDILDTDPEKRREYEHYHKLQDDPRVTPIGRVLRRFSLDELPQLLNVLWGDMSLVGPRAYMPVELPKMNGLSRAVLQTPPGITGLWQVSGRNNIHFEGRVELDVHYIQNWSPWLDLYLLVRTFPVVVTGKGAG